MAEAKLLNLPPQRGPCRDTLLHAARRFLLCREQNPSRLAQADPPVRHLSLVGGGDGHREPDPTVELEEAQAQAELRVAVTTLCDLLMQVADQFPSVTDRAGTGNSLVLPRPAES